MIRWERHTFASNYYLQYTRVYYLQYTSGILYHPIIFCLDSPPPTDNGAVQCTRVGLLAPGWDSIGGRAKAGLVVGATCAATATASAWQTCAQAGSSQKR